MLRLLKLIVLAIIMIGLILIGVANRSMVSVNFLPEQLSGLLPSLPTSTPEVPLFVVILASVGIGLLLGYIIEYFREAKHRRLANAKTREASQLKDKVKELQRRTGETDDDVLALLN